MLKIFANKGETGAIPLNAENLNYNFNEVLNLIYPIGAIIIKDSDTDYSNYLGFSWQKVFAGKTLVGLDTSDSDFNLIGKTGGEKTHTLVADEIPPLNIFAPGELSGQNFAYLNNYDGTNGSSIGTTPIGKTKLTPAVPHNILQPYKVVAFWKRVE